VTSLLLIALAVSPVEAAKAHLQRGELDEVPFDLEGKTLKAAEQPEAVKVLAETSKAALAKKDDNLALMTAQMALKLDAKSPLALEAAARAAFAQQEFETAERRADAWLAVEPGSAAARQLRAELAAEAGEWDTVLAHTGGLDTPGAMALRARAERERSQRAEAVTQLKSFEKALEEARKQKPPKGAETRPMAQARSTDVVLYGTAWCGFCKKAREWLTRKGVTFTERDVETDEDAVRELAKKAEAAGFTPSGVPVLDVRGKLIQGFDPREIERAL